jgi:hypothetical protein
MRLDPEMTADFAEARPNLRPKLWSRSMTEHMRLKRLYPDAHEGELDSRRMQTFLSACANAWSRRRRANGHVFQGRYRT